MIGGAVTWALDAWKRVEEIREIRERASKISAFDEARYKLFDDIIEKTIAEEIETKAKELQSSAKDSRKPEERRSRITWALRTLLALIERGLKVEIRSLPPPPSEVVEGQEAVVPAEFKELDETIPRLVFPKVEGSPVLNLPPPEPPPESAAKAEVKPVRPPGKKSPKK